MLELCPDGANLVDTARMPLDAIIDVITTADAARHDVARLHSGDLSLYSAMTEQQRLLSERGVVTEIVPGVPAFAAAAAALGSELTVPGWDKACSSPGCRRCPPTCRRARRCPNSPQPASPSLCIWRRIVHRRSSAPRPHYGADCPTATVAFASRADEQVVRCPLAALPDALAAASITKTAVIFVGRVLEPQGYTRLPTVICIRPPVCPNGTTVNAILILGGTGEGRELAGLPHDAGIEVITSLAGRVAQPRLPVGEVRIGGFGQYASGDGVTGLTNWLRDNNIQAVVDATHPFAATITHHSAEATRRAGVPLLRLRRPAWDPPTSRAVTAGTTSPRSRQQPNWFRNSPQPVAAIRYCSPPAAKTPRRSPASTVRHS